MIQKTNKSSDREGQKPHARVIRWLANNKETQVILGPYSTVNLLKNDYIKLQNFGFEELNFFINE